MKKLLVQTGTLKTAMKYAAKAILKNSPLIALDYFLCCAKGGKLTITGCNLSETISVTIRCEMRDEMEFLFPSSDLKFIEKLESDSIVTLYANDKYIELATDSDKLKNDAQDVGEYPRIPVCEVHAGTVHADFISEIKTSINYMGRDEMRPQMGCIFLEATSADTYRLTATDAHRLRIIDLNGEMVFVDEKGERENYIKSYMMPFMFCKLLAMYKDADKITLKIDEKSENISASFIDNDIYDIEICGRLVDGDYPNYRGVMPDENLITVTYDKKHLLKVIDKGSVVANNTTFKGLFIINNETKLLVENPDAKKEYTGMLSGQHTGDNIEIAFNLNLLSDTVKDIRGEMVKIEMSKPNRAVIMKEENTLTLLMPVMNDF